MARRTIFEDELELLASQLIVRYPMGSLSEIEVGWPCSVSAPTTAEAI